MKRTRLERAAAIAAKRPPTLRVHVTYAPRPERHERIVDLILALLDERRRSGRV